MDEEKSNIVNKQNSVGDVSLASVEGLFLKLKKVPVILLIAVVVVVFGLIFGFIFLFSRNSNEAKSEKVSKLSKEAQVAYKTGDFNTVEKKMSDVLETLPGDPRAQATLIKAIANQGNITGTEKDSLIKAKPYIEDAMETNPNDIEVLLAVGYAYETAGEYTKALEYYERALEINEKDPQVLFHKGHVLEFLGKQEEAFQLYVDAYGIDSSYPDVVMAYAKVQLISGNKEEAAKLYKDVSELSDANANIKAEALTNAAIIKRVDLQDLATSIEYSSQAILLAENFSPALAEHGFNLAMNNQLDEGISYMLKAIKTNPRISQNYWRIGGLYRLNGDYNSALQYQDQALVLVDMDNTILNEDNRKIIKAAIEYDLATTNLRLGNKDKVIPLLTNAVANNPNLKKQLKIDFEEYKVFESLNQDAEIVKLTL